MVGALDPGGDRKAEYFARFRPSLFRTFLCGSEKNDSIVGLRKADTGSVELAPPPGVR